MDVPAGEVFLESLDRCTVTGDFATLFYDRFLASSEEVKAKFKTTNFGDQKPRLLQSLRLIGSATMGNIEGLRELRARAETHDRYHLSIKPKLYELWQDAALKTASECDPLWDDDIARAWENTLAFAVQYMCRRF